MKTIKDGHDNQYITADTFAAGVVYHITKQPPDAIIRVQNSDVYVFVWKDNSIIPEQKLFDHYNAYKIDYFRMRDLLFAQKEKDKQQNNKKSKEENNDSTKN